jgi:branched-chain amino acid aminotransferase
VVFTPVANGTFLAGITRQRVIGLLRQSGVTVVEKTLTYSDFETADEIFATGNYSKVVPATRIGNRTLPFGPLYTRRRENCTGLSHTHDLGLSKRLQQREEPRAGSRGEISLDLARRGVA